MGIQFSTAHHLRDDNLLFPPEILEKIQEHLTIRDQLICRGVCFDWKSYLDASPNLYRHVIIKVEDSEERLRNYEQEESRGSVLIPCGFSFKNVQFSTVSFSFWNQYGHHLTHIDFYSCTFPSTLPQDEGLRDQCPNLQHLSIRKCCQYLMMGKLYFRLHNLFSLTNLQSLDLSQNNYLSDYAVLSLVRKTQRLQSLNLSECNLAVTYAVFKRFYPQFATSEMTFDEECGDNEGDVRMRDCFSDNILTFHMIHRCFLSTSKGKYMKQLILDDTRMDIKSLRLIMDPDSYSWESISLNKCTELKSSDIVEFVNAQQRTLRKLEIEGSKLRPGDVSQINFTNFNHLVIKGCGELTNVDFLQNMNSIEYFDMSTCAGVQLQEGVFTNCKKLKVLKMKSSIPFYMLNNENSPVSPVLIRIFSHLPSLRELDLSCCGGTISDEVLQGIITYLPLLQVLKLCKSKITDRGTAGLEIDDFENSRLSPHAISTKRANIIARNNLLPPGLCLSKLIHLKELSLSYCLDLSEATWRYALRLPTLSKLDISGCSQVSIKGFLSIVENCKSLEHLSIVQCGVHITSDPDILSHTRHSLYRLRDLVI